ncbi:MAG: hypothetical protein NZM65_07440 [Flavobacteriales bacterium]|nr:hypothetical protein [Flavobacteriales bacterium]MDW8410506.1 TrmH family RNA methyltransferase [Flavobacteriales bacterium]
MEWPALPRARQSLIGKLHQKKYRYAEGLYLAEGAKVLSDSLRHGGQALFIVLAPEKALPEGCTGIPVFQAGREFWARYSGQETPAGVMGVFRMAPWAGVETLERASRILVLDGLNDPGNVGTLLRAAHWFGFRHVVLTPTTADPYNPKAVQAAMGSLPALILYRLEAEQALRKFQEDAIPVYVSALEGASLFPKNIPEGPLVLVLGSESHGVSAAWEGRGIFRIRIPPADAAPPESLNVALAGAILMHRLAQGGLG